MDGDPSIGKPASRKCLYIHVDYICCVLSASLDQYNVFSQQKGFQ